MATNSSIAVLNPLLENLKLDEPTPLWVPPRSWDSNPSKSASSHAPNASLYANTSVSEPSLVRLAMNALQGAESALLSISELYPLFRYSSADRTFHRIPSLWTRCSSTLGIGDLLGSIGQFGSVVFLLRSFVDYFATPEYDGVEGKSKSDSFSLINQAFAIAVRKVIDGYVSALDTLSASISLRRCLKTDNGGCLTSIGHSEATLLEIFLHTAGLRTQIEALGNVCNVSHLSFSFPVSSLQEMKSRACSEFSAFPRGGALLSCLYSQLKVANPDHCSLLKFLFLQSYEPYCGFIRSWIYDGRLTDPYDEFVVEYVYGPTNFSSDGGNASDLPLPTIRARDGVIAPCFLEECLIPLCRTGQQLQVIMKLLELCDSAGAYSAHMEILPCLSGLSSKYSWFAFPLTFSKGIIETMSLERTSYYQQMLENAENNLTKFDFSSQEVVPHHDTSRLVNNVWKSINMQASSIADGNLIPSRRHRRKQNMSDNAVDSDVSSIMDDYSYDEDFLESSECSSSEGFEEQNAVVCMSDSVNRNYLSAIDFSFNTSTDRILQKSPQSEVSCSVEHVPLKISDKLGHPSHLPHNEKIVVDHAAELSHVHEIISSRDDIWLHDDRHSKKDEVTWLPKYVRKLDLLHCDSDLMVNIPVSNTSSESLSNLHLRKLKYDSTVFSMNPTLYRGSLLNPRTLLGDTNRASYSSSYFDFTSVSNPVKASVDKLADHPVPRFAELIVKSEAPAAVGTSNRQFPENHNDVSAANNSSSLYTQKNNEEEVSLLPPPFGGSTWQSLLSGSRNIAYRSSTSDHRNRLLGAIEMPLDFVIRKCLLDEITLQYKYISKLTIKLLTEGFRLQKHLSALRGYHFMELADWADLFIMSLWNRKWHVNEVDKRIPEIQGILELSVQRSSCEGDPNKERLFVYLKGDNTVNYPASATGIHSFDFLGLGYRVDWPVNIILTPAALNIYSEIFNFLIQVKLAVFSLSKAWCSLKSYCVHPRKGEECQVSILIETRHKLNHFVSTLQQYVQSQLSQVSWCRFLQSLKNKVEDMLDLESVHMAYLTESLYICFLSSEAKPIASVIQNILQCAMDFRSCLTGGLVDFEFDDEKVINRFSWINISQVHSIRTTFIKNLQELHSMYLRAPKHGEFSIARFWDFLNYNDYYAGIMSKQTNQSIFHSYVQTR